MRVQFCQAGPSLVLQSAVVQEIEVGYDLEQGLITFAGRIGEEWMPLGWYDVLLQQADVERARPNPYGYITSVFISTEDEATIRGPHDVQVDTFPCTEPECMYEGTQRGLAMHQIHFTQAPRRTWTTK